MIFDFEEAEYEEREQEESGETFRVLKPAHVVKLLDHTYDRLLGCYINGDDVMDSWVILQSKKYEKIHLLRLRDLLAFEEDWNLNGGTAIKTLGGIFIESTEAILFSVKPVGSTFWDNIKVRFTHDGIKASV